MDELLQAQKRLGQTLERASIGEDRQLAAEVRDRGEAFTNLLHGVLRMTRMYDLNNDTFAKPLVELRKVLDWLLGHLGIVHLVTVEDQVYINDVRIRFNLSTSTGGQVGVELRRHNVGGISFHARLTEEQLLGLCACLAAQPEAAERRAALCRELAARGIAGVEVSGLKRYLQQGEEQQETEFSEVLQRAATLVEETWDNVAAGRMLNPLALRRMVVELLAAGIDTDGLWGEVRGETEHGAHAVRVTRVTLAIATGAGLDDRTQQDLGVTALVHDLGYVLAGPWAGPKRSSFREHIPGGALVMVRQRGFHAAKIHRILGILYHHHAYKDIKEVPSLFGRVLRIAEDYDNLCQARGGGLSPPAALGSMVSAAGTLYDPVLLQVAVNRLGRYPPGTQVQLEDGRTGRTISLVRSGLFDKPRVVTGDGRVVDLAQSGRIIAVQ